MEILWEIEADFVNLSDDNYEGYIYDSEDIFNAEMDIVPLPDESNFYCELFK